MALNLSLLKYATLKSSELTAPIVMEIAKGLGIDAEVTDETMASLSNILKIENIESLADLLGSPTVFPKIQKLLMDSVQAVDDNLIICPHCHEYINPQV